MRIGLGLAMAGAVAGAVVGVMVGAAAPASAYWDGGYYAPHPYSVPYYQPRMDYPPPAYAAPVYAIPRPYYEAPVYAAPVYARPRVAVPRMARRVVRRARMVGAPSPFEAAGIVLASAPRPAAIRPPVVVTAPPASVAAPPAPQLPAAEGPPARNVYPPEREFTPFTGD